MFSGQEYCTLGRGTHFVFDQPLLLGIYCICHSLFLFWTVTLWFIDFNFCSTFKIFAYHPDNFLASPSLLCLKRKFSKNCWPYKNTKLIIRFFSCKSNCLVSDAGTLVEIGDNTRREAVSTLTRIWYDLIITNHSY